MIIVKSCSVPSTFRLSILRFIADGMLGKLTRWLRLLGQDVDYHRSTIDKKLIELANSENRILLTRDLDLYHQALSHGVEAVLVEGTDETERLADLAYRFGFHLEVDLSISRCPKCNAILNAVLKDAVIAEIPELTAAYYNDFWKCVDCGQVYWRGAHWKQITKTLEYANSRLSDR